MIFLTGASSQVKESPENLYDYDDDDDDDDADVDLERDGGLVGGEKGVPVKLPLEFLTVLTVHKLEHGLVHHVRLRIWIIYLCYSGG